jgi:hypothetical protein
VAKILAYELDPPTGDWFDNVFLAGALMDEPNRLDDPYTLPNSSGYSDEGYDPYTDNAYEVTQKVRAVFGEERDFIDLADYPYFEGGKYKAANDTLNGAAATSAWARGNAFVFWASHGYEAVGALAEYEGSGTSGMFESAMPFITTADTIVNTTGGMLPLVYISSCYAGQFDKADYTNFEQMLTVPEGGAIALIAGDGDTFRLENISVRSFGNWWLGERFFQLVLDEGMVRPGEALATLKHEYHTYYLTEGPPPTDGIDMDYFYANLYSYNLQGDPEVPVWVGTPDRLELEVLGGAVFNSPAMRFRVTDRATGEPVKDAVVHARGAGLAGLLETVTDDHGLATFSTGPRVMGEELRLAVTKDNWVPDRQVVTVDEGVRDLRLTEADLVGPTEKPYKDELTTFLATVTNTGDFPLSRVTVHFDSGDLNAPDTNGVNGRNQTLTLDMPVGQDYTIEFKHRYTAPGEYDVIARVDPEDLFQEANEMDNEAIHHLRLYPTPTLPESIGPFNLTVGEVIGTPIDLESFISFEQPYKDVSFRFDSVSDGLVPWIDADNHLYVMARYVPDHDPYVSVLMNVDGVWAGGMKVMFDVRYVNTAPVVAAIPDMEVSLGDTLTIQINATDLEGERLYLSTSLEDASIVEGRLTWTPGSEDVGVHYTSVTAMDMLGMSTRVWFIVTVTVQNSVPTIQAVEEEISVEKDEKAHIAVNALDPDGDIVHYHLATSDEGFSIDEDTGLLTFDSSGLEPGRYTATVIASDGEASDQQAVEVTVEGTASVPVLWLMMAGLLLLAVAVVVLTYRR